MNLLAQVFPLMKPALYAHVRFSGLPALRPGYHGHISQLRSSEVGRMVWVRGTIVKAAQIKMIETQRQYQCASCGYEFTVTSDFSMKNQFEMPQICPSGEHAERGLTSENDDAGQDQIPTEVERSSGRGGRGGRGRGRGRGRQFVNIAGVSATTERKRCRSNLFEYKDKSSTCRDYQEVRLQEPVHLLDVGRVPRSLPVVLLDDLVGAHTVGQDVIVCGVLSHQWYGCIREQRCDLDLIVVANSVTPIDSAGDSTITDQSKNSDAISTMTTSQLKTASCGGISEESALLIAHLLRQFKKKPFALRGHLLASVCPSLCGVWPHRLATLLMLCGGVGGKDPDSGMVTRGSSHVLIIGDPGTGKSQLLKFACSVPRRGVMTTGSGSSRAGLTVAAVADAGNEWSLEAGALVLADGGVCCIDEFGTIKEQDRASIYEAMEQQTISVAKAGMVATLRTRCSVFAVQNPRGRYDYDMDVSSNSGIPPPLLSRFDVVLLLNDEDSSGWDNTVANAILQQLPLPTETQIKAANYNTKIKDASTQQEIAAAKMSDFAKANVAKVSCFNNGAYTSRSRSLAVLKIPAVHTDIHNNAGSTQASTTNLFSTGDFTVLEMEIDSANGTIVKRDLGVEPKTTVGRPLDGWVRAEEYPFECERAFSLVSAGHSEDLDLTSSGNIENRENPLFPDSSNDPLQRLASRIAANNDDVPDLGLGEPHHQHSRSTSLSCSGISLPLPAISHTYTPAFDESYGYNNNHEYNNVLRNTSNSQGGAYQRPATPMLYPLSFNAAVPQPLSLPFPLIREYIMLVRNKIFPKLSSCARKVLAAYYQQQRAAPDRDKSQTTVRLLEALVRLTQAHARLHCRSIATHHDAIQAISLVDYGFSQTTNVRIKEKTVFDPLYGATNPAEAQVIRVRVRVGVTGMCRALDQSIERLERGDCWIPSKFISILFMGITQRDRWIIMIFLSLILLLISFITSCS